MSTESTEINKKLWEEHKFFFEALYKREGVRDFSGYLPWVQEYIKKEIIDVDSTREI